MLQFQQFLYLCITQTMLTLLISSTVLYNLQIRIQNSLHIFEQPESNFGNLAPYLLFSGTYK